MRCDHFGRTVRILRKLMGLTMGDLADTLGWPVSKLSDIERGLVEPPDMAEVLALARALKLPSNARAQFARYALESLRAFRGGSDV